MKKLFFFLVKMMLIIVITPIMLVTLEIMLLLLGTTINYNSASDVLSSQKFEQEKWSSPYSIKVEMYQDLRDNYLKIGMPINEVKNLIGETRLRHKYTVQSDQIICLKYDLGMMGYLHTPYDLIICPDKTGECLDSIKLIGGWYGLWDKGQKALIEENGNLEVYDTKTSYDWSIERLRDMTLWLIGLILLYKASCKIFSLRV